MNSLSLRQGSAEQVKLARLIASKFDGVANEPCSVSVAGQQTFQVLLIVFSALELRALLFLPPDTDEQQLVQVNLIMRPIGSSPRQIFWTASYEELGLVYAGTSVEVLSERCFAEFMKHYDHLDDQLQAFLDGDDADEDPRLRLVA